jgi:pilus assembly protein Flp/PilA
MNIAKALVKDESGQGMTEYAILIGTLAIAVVLTLVTIGGKLSNIFSNVSTQLNQVPGASS